MCEFVNGSRALFVFNGCVFYQAKAGYWFFISLDSKEISNKETLPLVKEYCLAYEQRLKSKQKIKWDYAEELLREELLAKWERGRLFFADSGSKGSDNGVYGERKDQTKQNIWVKFNIDGRKPRKPW